jgi:predicted RNase H-like HicB family nuclease
MMAARRERRVTRVYDLKGLLEPDETGGYVATCPSLPGCYSQGDTVNGALDNTREAIELCLEDMQAHAEVIPEPSRILIGSVVVTRRRPGSPSSPDGRLFASSRQLGHRVVRQRGSHIRLRHQADPSRSR